jgi:hypothetical protein
LSSAGTLIKATKLANPYKHPHRSSQVDQTILYSTLCSIPRTHSLGQQHTFLQRKKSATPVTRNGIGSNERCCCNVLIVYNTAVVARSSIDKGNRQQKERREKKRTTMRTADVARACFTAIPHRISLVLHNIPSRRKNHRFFQLLNPPPSFVSQPDFSVVMVVWCQHRPFKNMRSQ